MKANRLFPIAFVFSLLLPACTSTPTVEITPTVEPTEIDTPLAATLTPTVESQDSIVTTPLPVSTRTPSPPTPVPALTSLPADTGSNACPDTQPSLLMPGRQGRVSNLTPDPNRVRAEPDAQAEILGEIPAGAYFDVLEGPTCAADGAWFKVRYETLEGWMKEGSSTEYWVMPIYSEARTLTGPEIEVAGFAVTLPVEAGTTAQVQDAPFYPDENIPPVSLLRLPEYPLYNGSPSIYIYPVQDYLYYRADLRPRLEGIRTAVNRLIVDTRAISSLPEFCDAFLADQIYLLQVGRFAHGWGLRAVAITDDDENTPTYVFMGYSTDLSHLFYVRLPVRLMYGELAANVSPDDFMPSITQLDSLLQFSPWRPLPGLPDPSVAGACPGAPPFTLAVGDWARVSVVPPQTSRLRSTTGMAGTVVTEAQPGENLLVIDGPRCANGYTWWQVRTLEGLEGWAAEGDADSYWLVEPISVWYPLPTSLSTGSIQHYDLREINISASASLVNDISGSYSPASTPIPPPDNDETPMPEGSCASDFSATFCAEHSAYGIRSDVIGGSYLVVFDLQDPLTRYYLNHQPFAECNDAWLQNLVKDTPNIANIQPFCGMGQGIPIHWVADVQTIQFSGGRGLRFLIASANNQTVEDMEYFFQGLSDDGRYYIVAHLRSIYHPYIVDSVQLVHQDFGPLLQYTSGQWDEAAASYTVFNERMLTLLNAHAIPLYPQLSLLDEMMASIVIK